MISVSIVSEKFYPRSPTNMEASIGCFAVLFEIVAAMLCGILVIGIFFAYRLN